MVSRAEAQQEAERAAVGPSSVEELALPTLQQWVLELEKPARQVPELEQVPRPGLEQQAREPV